MSDTLECLSCGSGVPSRKGDGVFYCDDAMPCPDCRTVNHVDVNEQGAATFWGYTCVHGKIDDEVCDACESIEEPLEHRFDLGGEA